MRSSLLLLLFRHLYKYKEKSYFISIKRRTVGCFSEEEKIKTGRRCCANLFMENTIILFYLFKSGEKSDLLLFLDFLYVSINYSYCCDVYDILHTAL